MLVTGFRSAGIFISDKIGILTGYSFYRKNPHVPGLSRHLFYDSDFSFLAEETPAGVVTPGT